MELNKKIKEIFEKNQGVVTTAQAIESGASRQQLYSLAKKELIERVNHGVYILPDIFVDKMHITQIKSQKAIFSHETALYLHDLTDRDPVNYSVTVPSKYHNRKLIDEGITVYFVKKELHEIGITKEKTMFGNIVMVYNVERTICDCLRSRNRMDADVIINAMKRYAKRPDKDIHLLTNMAETFKVSKLLKTYMEVLL